MTLKRAKTGKRSYSHNTVLRLIELHKEISEDPEEIIRTLVRSKLEETKNLGWNGPPFDPQILASIMGIRCEPSKELVHSDDAELHPLADGKLMIKYNPDKPKPRQNFSIAHEIAHTFFPEYGDQYKARHKIGQFNPESEIEFLCDLGASEIIMPASEFNPNVKEMGISLKSLRRLSKRYNASQEATAIRMITTNLDYCALMVLGYNYKPSELSQIENAKNQPNLLPSMKLRVQYSVPAEYFSTYIPKHKSIEESSPLYEVSVTRKPFEGNAILNFTSPTLDTYVEAVALPRTHNATSDARVLVFIF